MELILDIGSGKTLSSFERGEAMIKAVAEMDSHKHKIVFQDAAIQERTPEYSP